VEGWAVIKSRLKAIDVLWLFSAAEPGLSRQHAHRPDGTIVSVYYYNDDPAGERCIAATLCRL
jgi:hypothetical protein